VRLTTAYRAVGVSAQDGRLLFIAGPDRCCSYERPDAERIFAPSATSPSARAKSKLSVLNWSPSFRAAPPPFSGENRGGAQTSPFLLDRLGGGFQASGHSRRGSSLASDVGGVAHWETGGTVAVATTSLPEQLVAAQLGLSILLASGRDSRFMLIGAGILDEAKARHEWLLRAVAVVPRRSAVSTAWLANGGSGTEIPWPLATKARLRSNW
jgi:hypothetical protein